MVIFDQWKKLCLGLNAEAEIQLLNCIYLIYRSSPRASRTLSIIVLVLVTVYAMGPSKNTSEIGKGQIISSYFPKSAILLETHYLGKSYYVDFLRHLGSNGFQLN